MRGEKSQSFRADFVLTQLNSTEDPFFVTPYQRQKVGGNLSVTGVDQRDRISANVNKNFGSSAGISSIGE